MQMNAAAVTLAGRVSVVPSSWSLLVGDGDGWRESEKGKGEAGRSSGAGSWRAQRSSYNNNRLSKRSGSFDGAGLGNRASEAVRGQ